MSDPAVDPITDYDILERALGKLTMQSPNEHARGVAALHRIRSREMNGPELPVTAVPTEYARELEEALKDAEGTISELKQLDEKATRQLIELRAVRAYTDEVLRQLRPQLEAQDLGLEALLPDWESMTAEYQDLWREAARDDQ